MAFEKNLVLFRYFLNLFGFENFNELRNQLVDKEEGYDCDGRSNFLNGVINIKGSKINEDELLAYDRAIKKYVEKLRKNKRDPVFNLKYFQYIAVLFSEVFFDRFFNRRKEFLRELNDFLYKYQEEQDIEIEPFSEKDLYKIAFSMATGSGKTLIMHINYWQILKYSSEKYDNIVLIPPNEGLSRQHFKEMKKSGIPCKLYDGNVDNIATKPNEVLIVDIHKLVEEKIGKGVRIDVSYFDGKNLVFVDEGHKGRKSEDEVWRKRREEIARDGYILEYSATFRQVIGDEKELLDEYGKSIVFEYSYKYFYEDGYGKDFYVYNLQEDRFSGKYRDLLLTANLLSFYEQLKIFKENGKKLNSYNIERPLLTFVGGTVTGQILKSDVPTVVFFFKKVLDNEEILVKNVKKILSGESDLIDKDGNDVFEGKFRYLEKHGWDPDDFYGKVFGGKGRLEAYELKNSDGEIGLRVSTNEEYFGVISVGDVYKLRNVLKGQIEVKSDDFTPSLFFDINEEDSPVNVLIGSRKFVEGWDSWRVSGMGLLNIGKGKGSQIIQLFGRGVRLKGRDFSLKREDVTDYTIRRLQTFSIFGLNADYMNQFLDAVQKEEVEYEKKKIKIGFNRQEEWDQNLYTLETDEDFDFMDKILRLDVDEDILAKLRINLRPKMTVAEGLETERAETARDESNSIVMYLDLLDWEKIYLEIMRYKNAKGYYNLIIDEKILHQVIESDKYELLATEEQVTPYTFKEIQRIREIALTILKSYIDKFYRAVEKRESTNRLRVKLLDEKDDNFNFKEIVVKIPNYLIDELEDLFGEMEKFYERDIDKIPTIHFDNHLYSPLAVWKKGEKYQKIKTSPVKLNKGESEFVKDLRNFLDKNGKKLGDRKVFLLRNLSRRGIGFFQKAAGFYPDFILWIKEDDKQRMTFVDPKGLRLQGNFNDDKIRFCTNFVHEIERRAKQQIRENDFNDDLELQAFIISVSDYDSIKKSFGSGNHTKQEFKDHNIAFQEGDYIRSLIDKIIDT